MIHVFLICFLFSFYGTAVNAQIDECEPVPLADNEVHTFESVSPYDKCLCLKVATANGYKFEITVKSIDIDGLEPLYDYLLIKPGLELEEPGDGKVFTHILKNERSYVLFSNNAFIQFNAHPDSDGNINPHRRKGFQMTYKRIGEAIITTTTEAPNPNPLPTPGGADAIYITVYLDGKRLFEYTQIFVEKLRIIIMEMAKAYCEFASVPIDRDETLNTHENVKIHSLMDCPWNWPDRDHCVSMQFSLPLYMQADYEEYQLNQTNLRNMWHHFNSQYLGILNLRNYEAPDAQTTFNIWIILIICIVVAFAVFLGVFKWLVDNVLKPRDTRLLKDDNTSTTSRPTSLSSPGRTNDAYNDDDMQPDSYQTFPAAPADDDDDDIKTFRIYDNHSKPKPDVNRVVLLEGNGFESFMA